jgi:hypothetical protein
MNNFAFDLSVFGYDPKIPSGLSSDQDGQYSLSSKSAIQAMNVFSGNVG